MKKTRIFLFLFIVLFTSCDHHKKHKKSVLIDPGFGYNLSFPDRVYKLPEELQEISDITEIDSSKIACVQDELETIYIYDLNSSQITSRINGGYKGDYEGIARVGKTIYLLRSDGIITEINNFRSREFIRSTYKTSIPYKDNEGLCYDPSRNILLITPKETPAKGSGMKKERFIYGFSLITKKLIQEPVFTINLSAIDNFALANSSKVPMKEKKNGKKKEPDIKFQISAMAIHPITGGLFLLSSIDKLLFVINRKNEIEFIQKLNPNLFKQPEGITFMKNGDMYISNEGKKKSATLIRFNYNPATIDSIRKQ